MPIGVETHSRPDSGLHVKARTETPAGYPARFPVPAELTSWEVAYPAYQPPVFVDASVSAEWSKNGEHGWADPNPYNMTTEERATFVQTLRARMKGYGESTTYDQSTGLPRNPRGRTGITGQGLLGRVGENTAADPILLREHDGSLEVLLIKRRSPAGDGQWALPGGMVEPGDTVSRTLLKECIEETLAATEILTSSAKEVAIEQLRQLLDFENKGVAIYSGYVDDPRNTDISWIVTNAFTRLLTIGDLIAMNLTFGAFRAGDDAAQVGWRVISRELMPTLYASHAQLVSLAAQHWHQDRAVISTHSQLL